MDERLLEKLKEQSKGRPYNIIRHVGNRLEVMFYGEYVPVMIEIKSKDIDLEEVANMKVADLRKVAKNLEIETKGLKKTDLLKAITEAIRGK